MKFKREEFALFNESLKYYGLSLKSVKALRKLECNMDSLDELLESLKKINKMDLLNLRNVGMGTLTEIRKFIKLNTEE